MVEMWLLRLNKFRSLPVIEKHAYFCDVVDRLNEGWNTVKSSIKQLPRNCTACVQAVY